MDIITNTNSAYIVSWDFTRGKDVGVLIVGKKRDDKTIDIVNAFQGQEAYDIYEKLSTRKKVEEKV